MTLGELLDRTFHLYRRHFLLFVGIIALPQLIVLAMQLARPTLGAPTDDPAESLARFGSLMLWSATIGIVGLVVGSIAQGATVFAVSEVHLGRAIGIGRAYGAIRHRIGLLILMGFVVGLSIGVGLLLCLVPGVLLALVWALVVPVAVIEGTGFTDATRRSRVLTQGFRGRIFLTGVLYFVLTMVVNALWQVPITVASIASMRTGTSGELPGWAHVLAPIGAFVTQCLTGPLLTIALSLTYYDVRVRKEGFDIEHLMAQLDRPAAEGPAAMA